MESCPFCRMLREGDDYLVGVDANVGVILDRAPVFPGHALVVPARHVADLTEATDDELLAVARTARRLARGLRGTGLADGTLVLTNVAVSQSVPHLHCHVVPRRRGDGLRGFLWPRRRYTSDQELARWRTALADILLTPEP